MECKHRNKLNDYNFCSESCYYCTYQQAAECKRKHPEYFESKRFDLQLTSSECDLLIWYLKPLEEELGMDITLLINKIKKHKDIATDNKTESTQQLNTNKSVKRNTLFIVDEFLEKK